ncbi:MAG: Phloretin hydrolase [Firmicutes bacterium]|nr:Phloretin hydrolase [Bacillota bacterium]
MEIKLTDWLQAVHHEVEMRRWRDQSGGKIKHFTVTQEFDITPAIIGWYMMNRDSESYRMWHPAHIEFQWEKKIAGVGATWVCWEKINGQMAAYRMRSVPVELSPIQPKNKTCSSLNIIMDTEESPLIYILNETESIENGTRITLTFIFPEATPDEYVEAHRQHFSEEFPNMIYKAVPFLIQRTFGYIPDTETIIKSKLIVPANN